MKARICLLSILLMLLLMGTAACEESDTSFRALLIGCDAFVSHAETTPSAALNVGRIARILESDTRIYSGITQYENGISGIDSLRSALISAFSGAGNEDVSLLYFCTHGLYDRISSMPSLVLSDGSKEETLDANLLRTLLDTIPGHKVLLFDACNSGAFIGKGTWDNALINSFAGGDYSVLTSAGANELSFLWHSNSVTEGGSYFAAELCEGLLSRTYDLNADGIITLSEAYQGLLETHGASTAQTYPQHSDFPLYVYDRTVPAPQEGPLSDFSLDTAVLDDGSNTLYFSFTVRRPVRVQYQLIYYRDGEWRFNSPQIIEDEENREGALSPGRKERSVVLNGEESVSGYILLQLVVQEGRYAMLAGSRLIAVQPTSGDPQLRVWNFSPTFRPEAGEELGIYVRHSFPCSLTVTVIDKDGRTVRQLCHKAPSRPLGEMQDGSYYYWNGRDDLNYLVTPGAYRVRVRSTVNSTTYEQLSGEISISN